MKRKRHTTDEIIRKLREADQLAAGGDTVPQICQKLEVSAHVSSPSRSVRAIMGVREAFHGGEEQRERV